MYEWRARRSQTDGMFEQVLFSAQSLGNETRQKSFGAHCENTESLDDFRYEQNHVFRGSVSAMHFPFGSIPFEIRRESNCCACPFCLSMGREINAESQWTRSVVSFVAIPLNSSLRSPRLCVSKRCSNKCSSVANTWVTELIKEFWGTLRNHRKS